MGKRLGVGGFGSVFLAELKQGKGQPTMSVVAKKVRSSQTCFSAGPGLRGRSPQGAGSVRPSVTVWHRQTVVRPARACCPQGCVRLSSRAIAEPETPLVSGSSGQILTTPPGHKLQDVCMEGGPQTCPWISTTGRATETHEAD